MTDSPDKNTSERARSGESVRTLRMGVPEMDCASCAATVEEGLKTLEGVISVEPSPVSGRVSVEYDSQVMGRDELVTAVEAAGYDVSESEQESSVRNIWLGSRGIKTWISGFFLATGLAVVVAGPNPELFTVFDASHTLADVLFLLGTVAGGEIILRHGVESARERSLDIDFLMSSAILGAIAASLFFGEGLYFEAATLAFLFNVAELLETHSMDKARTSLQELLDLSPDEARVRRDGDERTVPAGDVAVGETVVVRPGEKIPVDGVVIGGESAVDQSPVTGESVPVEKTTGDDVFAGTLTETGYLEIETTAGADEHTLARIVELVEDAEAKKTDREQFVDRFAGYYTPVVVGFALLAMVVPPVVAGASWGTWFVRGLTLLVLACPCAFVISTPVSVVSGITSAAKNGVLIKGGTHLEAMGEIDTVALDKTGTLTTGELTVTDVIPLNGHSKADVLQCARGVEQRSEHPISEAIVEHADERDISPGDIDEFEALTGKGVQATLDGNRHYAGKPGLFEELDFDLSHVHAMTDGGVVTTQSKEPCEKHNCLDLLDDLLPQLQSEGKTVVLVGTETTLEGVIAVADRTRPGAKEAVERLSGLGVERVVMLTGDNERTARAIAAEVGIDDVRAELLPERKVEAIRELNESGDGVAMVGDGINDAPALASASVGIAMSGAGTDTALETSDIALLGDDISKLPYLRTVSLRGNSVIRQNIWSSLGVKGLLAVLVPFGYVPIWVAVLVGDAGMTVGVTANAMRLSKITPD